MITLYTDFKSPAAYLALKPTLALIAEHEVAIRWLPYSTKQEAVPAEKTAETKTETHFRIRAKLRRDTHLRYAGVQGVPMNFRDTPGETDVALATLLALEGDALPFVETAFRAYWVEGADLNDTRTVRRFLEECNFTVSGEAVEASLEKLPAHQLAAEKRGIVDAPAYVVRDQIFIGREHLPWIRSILKSET